MTHHPIRGRVPALLLSPLLSPLLSLLLQAGAAHAAAGATSAPALQDPTRPPAGAFAPQAGAAATEAGPQLQSVLVGPAAGGRIAVIDGESVRVGERFRGARVARIADDEVELVRGGERQVLHLFAPETAGGISRVAAATAQRRAKGE